MITPETERIIDLLSKKLTLLEEVLEYSKEQRGLTFQKNSLKYNNLIESRAKCLEDLGKLEVVLERSLNRENVKIINDSGFQERLYELNSHITDTLKMIIELDKENKERMLKERAELKSKLHIVHKGQRGVAGYKGNNQFTAAGIFTDNKG